MQTLENGKLILKRYKILSLLGEGGMATVYLADDLEQNKKVALKFLNSDQLNIARRVARFTTEYSILSTLDHANIVKVYEQNKSEEGVPFFSMEAIAGESLAKLIKNSDPAMPDVHTITTEEALNILQQIAQALNYIHTQKIIYCDLKPDNIIAAKLNNESGKTAISIKLVDFGIARLLDQQSENDSAKMLGTSYYMSPEQIRSEKIDFSSDIYSFGVIAFEILTGQLPFSDPSVFSISAFHLVGKVPSARALNKAVPKPLDLMIKICMEKKPSNRYGSMLEIVQRLEALR